MQTTFPKWKLVAFALLSASDFLITYLLLSLSHGTVYEANPLANHWLQQNGWLGLAAFKAVLVFFVMAIATCAYYRRPRLSHDLLAISCGAVIVAVLTGTSIAIGLAGTPSVEESHFPNRRTETQHQTHAYEQDYSLLLDELARDLTVRRIDLRSAVIVLQRSDLATNEQWLASLRQAYPGIEDRALLAADIVQHAVNMRVRSESALPLAKQLEIEFKELYGVTPVLPYRQTLHLVPRAVKRS